MVVETLGMWTSFGLEMIKIVASRVALTQNQGLGQAVQELHERFSVCLWKWNARLILSRLSLSGIEC